MILFIRLFFKPCMHTMELSQFLGKLFCKHITPMPVHFCSLVTPTEFSLGSILLACSPNRGLVIDSNQERK